MKPKESKAAETQKAPKAGVTKKVPKTVKTKKAPKTKVAKKAQETVKPQKVPEAAKAPKTLEAAKPEKAPEAKLYAYKKTNVSSFHQAYFSPEWNNNAFKYLSVDGQRFSMGVINSYLNDPNNNSIFTLNSDGGLIVSLSEHFEMRIAFYPPNKPGHETFHPFKVIIVNTKNTVVDRENISGRMKKYKITK